MKASRRINLNENTFDIDDELRNMALEDENAFLGVKGESAVAVDNTAKQNFYASNVEDVNDELTVNDDIDEVEDFDDGKDAIVYYSATGKKLNYRPSPTFCEKVLRTDKVIQQRYDELKNYAMRFKHLKSRLSKRFDSINKGRLQFVKLCVAGKSLKLYLNLNINDVDPKFHCADVSDTYIYEQVPVFLRIKSDRAMGYAKKLIDQCAMFHGLVENKKYQEVDSIQMVEYFRTNVEMVDPE